MACFGVLAFLTSLFVGPAAANAQAVAIPAATASTVRGAAPLAIGQRETRDKLGALPRRGAGEQPPLAAANERPTTAGQGPTLAAAELAVPVLVPALLAGSQSWGERTGQVAGQMPGTRRDRAPPAPALALA